MRSFYAALLTAAGCLPYLLYKGLYLYEMQFLPEDRAPIQQHSILPMILDMVWIQLHGTGVRCMILLRFDHWVRSFMEPDLRRPLPISRTVADGATAFVLLNNNRREEAEWQLSPALYPIFQQAISHEKQDRFDSIKSLYDAWRKAEK